MSIMVNDYFYSRPVSQDRPSWYRLERYEYCDSFSESTLSAKRGIFTRRNSKKRSK